MEQSPINNLELAIMELEFNRTMRELSRYVPSINHIFVQRLAYFLIETRRAAYKASNTKCTLGEILAQFHVSYYTYYEWRFKWRHLLPSNVKKYVN